MSQVTVAQKLFEKFLMLARLDETQLSVMTATDDDDNERLIIGVPTKGGNFTPLAVLLTSRMLDQLDPDFKKSEAFQELFKKAAAEETGKFPADFGDGGVNPHFTAEVIDAIL